jgi:hypothetical protein
MVPSKRNPGSKEVSMLVRVCPVESPNNIDPAFGLPDSLPEKVYLVIGPNKNVVATSTSYVVASAICAALESLLINRKDHDAENNMPKLQHGRDYVFGPASESGRE